jgi:5'-3' exonuclease
VFSEPQKNLFYKIVLGDKSDNIMPIFKKCGPKTCEKYYENNELFLEALKKENAYEKYELNKKLVDFRELPLELVNKFSKENSELLETF